MAGKRKRRGRKQRRKKYCFSILRHVRKLRSQDVTSLDAFFLGLTNTLPPFDSGKLLIEAEIFLGHWLFRLYEFFGGWGVIIGQEVGSSHHSCSETFGDSLMPMCCSLENQGGGQSAAGLALLLFRAGILCPCLIHCSQTSCGVYSAPCVLFPLCASSSISGWKLGVVKNTTNLN